MATSCCLSRSLGLPKNNGYTCQRAWPPRMLAPLPTQPAPACKGVAPAGIVRVDRVFVIVLKHLAIGHQIFSGTRTAGVVQKVWDQPCLLMSVLAVDVDSIVAGACGKDLVPISLACTIQLQPSSPNVSHLQRRCLVMPALINDQASHHGHHTQDDMTLNLLIPNRPACPHSCRSGLTRLLLSKVAMLSALSSSI